MRRADEEDSHKKSCDYQDYGKFIESGSFLACSNQEQFEINQRQQQREREQIAIDSSTKKDYLVNDQVSKSAAVKVLATAATSFEQSESIYSEVQKNITSVQQTGTTKLRKGPLKKRLSPKLNVTSRFDFLDTGDTTAGKGETTNTTQYITHLKAPKIKAGFPSDIPKSHAIRSDFSNLGNFSSNTPMTIRDSLVSVDIENDHCMVPSQLSLKRTLSKQLLEEPILKTPKSLSSATMSSTTKEKMLSSNNTFLSLTSSYSWLQTPTTLSVSKKPKSYQPVTTTSKIQDHRAEFATPNSAARNPSKDGLNSTVDIIRIIHPYGTNPHVTITKRPRKPIFSPLAADLKPRDNSLHVKNFTRSEKSDSLDTTKENEDESIKGDNKFPLQAIEPNKPFDKKSVAQSKVFTGTTPNVKIMTKDFITAQPEQGKAISILGRNNSENAIGGVEIVNSELSAKPSKLERKKINSPFSNPKLFDNDQIPVTIRPCRCGSSRQVKKNL